MIPLFELNAVSHAYGRTEALTDVSLAVEPGTVGLVGQNGAGKSTLIRMLLGLIQPRSGTVRLLGEAASGRSIRLRGRVGYMSEQECLVPGLRGVEYAALGGELSGMPRREALRRAHEILGELGLEEARYRRLEQYSTGMKQRLKLAAALVHDPDVLLLDEPTAGLDPEGRRAMLAVIRSLADRPGKSLVLSTHLLADVERVCRSVIVLNRGQVVHAGPIDALPSGRERRYRLRWTGQSDGFLKTLTDWGIALYEDPRETSMVEATVPDAWPARRFFVLAHEHDVVLTTLEPIQEDLETFYRRILTQH